MKNILYILFLLPFFASAQVQYIGGVKTTVKNRGAFQVDSLLILPKHDTVLSNYSNADTIGRMVMKGNDLYYRDSTVWQKIAIGFGIDTTSLSNRIDERVKYSDSNTIYATQYGLDTSIAGIPVLDTTSLSNRINTKLTKGGDSDGAAIAVGTNDNYSFSIKTNSFERVIVYTSGNGGIGTSSDAGYKWDVNGTARIVNGLTVEGLTVGSRGVATNTVLGNGTLAALTSGTYNVGVGVSALQANTSGLGNVAIGGLALYSNTSGTENVSIGLNTLRANNGNYNVALGSSALRANTSGTRNSGIGHSALTSNTTGTDNTGVGYEALRNVVGAYHYNTGIGSQALRNLTTGSSNVAIGYYSGYRNVSAAAVTSADNSVLIGYDVRVNNSGETNQIAIGYQAMGRGSNTTTIGNSNTTSTLTYGTLTVTNIPTVTTYDSVAVINDGVINKVLMSISASATLDFPSTSSNSVSDLTVAVTGAVAGDVVSIGAPNGSTTDGTYFAWVSAADTVTVRFHNGAGGSYDPASGDFKVRVFK